MADSVWPTIHAERAALADDLAALPADQWQTQSLCADWTVHDVLAHMLSTAKLTPPAFIGRFLSSGFSFTKFANSGVAREGSGGAAATLAAFRAAAGRSSAPPGPADTWLGETLVHAEDIRRPLGITREYPLDAVTRTTTFYSRSNALIHGKDRVAGLTLRATDTDWSIGSGPVVEGPAVALMLATTGRLSVLDELSGPGVEVLRTR